jgi:MFS family permease
MKKTIFVLAAVATIVVGTLSAPTPADARWRGGGIGLGILGGVVAGAIIGSAIADHDGYYRYDDYRDAPRGCYWARKAWRDEDGNVHYGRPRQFCD